MSISMQTYPLQHLIDLRENVAALKAVKCRLYHEEVRHDGETGKPIPPRLPDEGYTRIGFCSPELRRQRLACGHTMSRYVLRDALIALSVVLPGAAPYDELHHDLEKIGGDIYEFDIAKGRTERHKTDLLVELERRSDAGEDVAALGTDIGQVEQEIAAIEIGHGLCVDRVARLQRVILGHLDTAIAIQGEDMQGAHHRFGLQG